MKINMCSDAITQDLVVEKREPQDIVPGFSFLKQL